ncbi:metallo-beta-lactamase superfamily protein [Mycolicibacterium conceptionense]|uniref:Metallo-beta-lactamase superfamily protein n=1 Tax=Mycolicibacterium conceptionense TaxID=451644 RepID=A0A0U1DJG1_9MYCO|nr:MBL fold metallo-hydrolase [Mycolicibacterium conceptionense]ORV24652.1 hypothetical protein AWB98_20640 [Mycolicibacterium conceptionense]CQD16615.1 metallo-beta-lactamase superfamily protein [Mycolicibacterium conceptionense]
MEPIAAGLWVVRGGFPKRFFNVYFIEEAGGVTVFDAGVRAMAPGLAAAAQRFGGIKRIVLGHAHQDHRGSAPFLGAPIFCHALERAEAESESFDYYDYGALANPVVRAGFQLMMPWFDGGPCEIAGTLSEGEDVAGLRVVHLPGHSPGQIALWRESDRIALTTDAFYTLDITKATLPFGGPTCTHPAFDHDHSQAIESLRKLADLEPIQAWPGSAGPVTGDVAEQLRAAASSPRW